MTEHHNLSLPASLCSALILRPPSPLGICLHSRLLSFSRGPVPPCLRLLLPGFIAAPAPLPCQAWLLGYRAVLGPIRSSVGSIRSDSSSSSSLRLPFRSYCPLVPPGFRPSWLSPAQIILLPACFGHVSPSLSSFSLFRAKSNPPPVVRSLGLPSTPVVWNPDLDKEEIGGASEQRRQANRRIEKHCLVLARRRPRYRAGGTWVSTESRQRELWASTETTTGRWVSVTTIPEPQASTCSRAFDRPPRRSRSSRGDHES